MTALLLVVAYLVGVPVLAVLVGRTLAERDRHFR